MIFNLIFLHSNIFDFINHGVNENFYICREVLDKLFLPCHWKSDILIESKGVIKIDSFWVFELVALPKFCFWFRLSEFQMIRIVDYFLMVNAKTQFCSPLFYLHA